MGMSAFDVFKDDACTDYAWTHIKEPSGGNDAKGANSCYSMSLHGGPWKSVMQYYGEQEG